MKIIKVEYYENGKTYYYDPKDFFIKKGYYLIVEADGEEEMVRAVSEIEEVSPETVNRELKPIKRMPSRREINKYENLKENEARIFTETLDILKEHKIEMKLVEVKYRFDGTKLTFYYTADGRVDFRELVKDLATKYKTRIEMRQIGVREEVKKSGGNGKCGRELCCCSFLDNLDSVTMKMAKDQNLSLSPNKITGYCGRLMCCLKYEEEVYKEKLSRLPKPGSIVRSEDGEGEVVEVEVLKEGLRVKYKEGNEFFFKKHNLDEIEVIKASRKEDKEDLKFEEED